MTPGMERERVEHGPGQNTGLQTDPFLLSVQYMKVVRCSRSQAAHSVCPIHVPGGSQRTMHQL